MADERTLAPFGVVLAIARVLLGLIVRVVALAFARAGRARAARDRRSRCGDGRLRVLRDVRAISGTLERTLPSRLNR